MASSLSDIPPAPLIIFIFITITIFITRTSRASLSSIFNSLIGTTASRYNAQRGVAERVEEEEEPRNCERR